MNRNDKLIVALLFAILLGWLWYSSRVNSQRAREAAEARGRQQETALSTNAAATAALSAVLTTNAAATPATPATPAIPTAGASVPTTVHEVDEQKITLRSPDMDLLVSSRGATILAATLPACRARPEASSGPVILDFNPQPALALSGLPGLSADADYTVATNGDTRSVTLTCRTPEGLIVERRIELRDRHEVMVTDRLANGDGKLLSFGTNWVSLGTIYRGASKNDEIAADSWAVGDETKVHHWSGDLPKWFGGGGGCFGGSAVALTDRAEHAEQAPQRWVALKSRFFVQAFASVTNCGFRIEAARDTARPALVVARVSGGVAFAGGDLPAGANLERSYRLYIGPKKLAYLSAMGQGLDKIMEFGFFTLACKPLVPLLNFFYALIPNYGVAIILLTILVRIVFWPLTHKSTQSMKRMRDIQPKIKAIQVQFKDEPQKVQQEIWRVYRENKVNPLSSCLPMLVQIPVFIALYTVLRSAVELRYAPFLWVADLSEPENLLAGVLPIPLNILPLLMAAATIWQSKLTPAMGDPMQQKMMTWMMPCMMLVFFYSMPAALSLYWTVSTLLAIAQLVWQNRGNPPLTPAVAGAAPDDHMTRQMRRRLER